MGRKIALDGDHNDVYDHSMHLTVLNADDVSKAVATIYKNTEHAIGKLRNADSSPMELLPQIKFQQIGYHPLEDRPLNLIEQVNQTFTYLTALEAASNLLHWHPDAGGFRLAPGAHAPTGTLDIESIKSGLVGAETFAAVSPSNNQKLKRDLEKLMPRPEKFKYAFFNAPEYNATGRQKQLEQGDVQVWSVGLDY